MINHSVIKQLTPYKRIFIGVLALCLLPVTFIFAAPPLAIQNTGAYPLNRYLEVLEDPNKEWTIRQVSSLEMDDAFSTNNGEIPNFGLTTSAYWVRFEVWNPNMAKSAWFLEVDLPVMEDVVLFYKNQKGHWERKQSGQVVPFAKKEVPHPNHVFELPIFGTSKTIYMRFESLKTMQIPLILWSPREFAEKTEKETFGLGLYFGLMSIMIFYNMFLYVSIREIDYLYYVLYAASFALFMLALEGLAIQYLWPDSPQWALLSVPMLPVMSTFFLFQFSQSFLNVKQYHPLLNRGMSCFKWGAVGVLILILSRSSFSVQLGAFYFLIGSIMVFLSAFLCWRSGQKAARFFLLAWVTLLFGVLVAVLTRTGFLPAFTSNELLVRIGSALEVTFLSFSLADRINILKKEKNEAQSGLLKAQRRAAEELEKKVEERTLNLKEAQAQLVQSSKMASLGEMATGVAHELNQPLVIISLNAEAGLEDVDEGAYAGVRSSLNTVIEQVGRADQIITHLRVFGRDTGKTQHKKVDINAMLDNSFILLDQQLKISGIEVSKTFSDELLPSWGDAIRLEQVVMNLLLNARDAMHDAEEKFIHIRSFLQQHTNLIEIEDTGPGIAEEHLDKIFDPFFTTKEVGQGTGLGLSIAYRIIQEHGGQLEVENLPEKGARFRILLPVIQ